MSLDTLFDSGVFNWIILPLLIFCARILDVSLGTIRISFVSKGLKYLASLIGFVEVIIWLLAIRVIMQNLNNAVCYIAYGAGFAMGTFIGLQIEKKLALGNAIIRIVTQKDATELINSLRSQGFGVTSIDAVGEKFNPVMHEAMMQFATDKYEENTVVEEFQKGYFLKDRLIRPAKVTVAKNLKKEE